MINAEIKIRELDYERNFSSLFPMAVKKLDKMEDPSMMVRFLQKMGGASMTAALAILNRMPEKRKGELLCAIVNLYDQEILGLLNNFLKNDHLWRNVRLGAFSMTQGEHGELALSIWDVIVNYHGLIQNDMVQQKIGDLAGGLTQKLGGSGRLRQFAAAGANLAARTAAAIMPAEVEKTVISMLEKEVNKGRLMELAARVLEEKGIFVRLEDINFVQVTAEEGQENALLRLAGEREVRLSKELEDCLLDAVADYLKFLMGESSEGDI